MHLTFSFACSIDIRRIHHSCQCVLYQFSTLQFPLLALDLITCHVLMNLMKINFPVLSHTRSAIVDESAEMKTRAPRMLQPITAVKWLQGVQWNAAD
ncbi:hypothetical protein Y032_0241g3368 [Ancylostoma ceylanicum]|uniref:Uncharacterized protein n=1 Tax=Ancylostoma ceylanicum TaxID=53326 RepID=A0A016SEI7_9BILA|nr:hypothetical protein Y032_0241g3368 [Ancylostoma ceylanicum]